jgi:hypothetical protein
MTNNSMTSFVDFNYDNVYANEQLDSSTNKFNLSSLPSTRRRGIKRLDIILILLLLFDLVVFACLLIWYGSTQNLKYINDLSVLGVINLFLALLFRIDNHWVQRYVFQREGYNTLREYYYLGLTGVLMVMIHGIIYLAKGYTNESGSPATNNQLSGLLIWVFLVVIALLTGYSYLLSKHYSPNFNSTLPSFLIWIHRFINLLIVFTLIFGCFHTWYIVGGTCLIAVLFLCNFYYEHFQTHQTLEVNAPKFTVMPNNILRLDFVVPQEHVLQTEAYFLPSDYIGLKIYQQLSLQKTINFNFITNQDYYSSLVFPTVISSERSSPTGIQSFTVFIFPNTVWALNLLQQVKDNEIRTLELTKRTKQSKKKGANNKKKKDLVVALDIQEPTRPFDFHVMATRVKRSYLSKDIEHYRCFLFVSLFNNSVSLQMMINHLLYIYGLGAPNDDNNNAPKDTRPIYIFFYWRVYEEEETIKRYKLLLLSLEQMQFLHFTPHLINPHLLKKRKKNSHVNFDARLYLDKPSKDKPSKLKPTTKRLAQYCLENNPEYPQFSLPKQNYQMTTLCDHSVGQIIADVSEIALIHEIPRVAVIISSNHPENTQPLLLKLQENQTLTTKFHVYEEYV